MEQRAKADNINSTYNTKISGKGDGIGEQVCGDNVEIYSVLQFLTMKI